jgi:3-deoxy-D-manno-octulosonic-acid transferase
MILAYRVLTTLLYPLFLIIIFLRKILNKEDNYRYKEKIFPSHFNIKRQKNSKLIWFHAASLGELKSIFPIVNELDTKKNLEFLITTITLSSGNLAKEEFKNRENIHHRFLPLDVFFLIEKFLNKWRPYAIFLVDSEIWPNLILQAKNKNILLGLVNARITSKTFHKWTKISKISKKIFSSFNLCLTSNIETKDFLEKLGASNIHFKGNIKLINQIDKQKIKNPNYEILKKKRFWLAASIHEGEDAYCLKTHINLKKKYQDLITIIAPRHIHRVQSIKKLSCRYNLNTQVLNKDDLIEKDKEIILINSFGVLNNYFRSAKSVFIGKSTLKKFENIGGQNPIDAALLGCRIYHGPYVYNFREIYSILEKNHISKEISNFNELTDNLISDLKSLDKDREKTTSLINNFGQKTLTDTMEKINYFLFNAI